MGLLTDITHKGTKFKPLLSVFTPKLEHYRKECIDHLLQFVDKLLKFIERDVLVVNESETFKSVLIGQKLDQFLLMPLRRYLCVSICAKLKDMYFSPRSATIGVNLDIVKEKINYLHWVADAMPCKSEPRALNQDELREYESLMYTFVALTYHRVVDNEDFREALMHLGYSAHDSPVPINLTVEVGNYELAIRMIDKGVHINQTLLWKAIVRAPRGNVASVTKDHFLEYLLQSNMFVGDEQLSGCDLIDLTLKAASEDDLDEAYRLVTWLLERDLTPKQLTDYEEFISKYNLEFFSPEQINNLKTLFNK